MKKLCYLLSVVGHALLLLVILNSEFRVTIIPEPPRVVELRIAEPLPHYFAPVGAAKPPLGANAGPGAIPDGDAEGRAATGGAKGAMASGGYSMATLASPAAAAFRLGRADRGAFRLAPVGRSPEPWASAQAANGPQGPLRYPSGVIDPLSSEARLGPARFSGGVFLMPFDIKEKAVSAWTEAVLTRIERNWIVPASARFTYSGRVQITLTIEKNGRSSALAIDDSSLPAILALAARHAVEASLPLPPLPENVVGETFAFTFVFVYNG